MSSVIACIRLSFVIKKILKSVDDQLKITVHFVTKNDPEESVNMFGKHFEPSQKINSLQQVAIEYIFVDGSNMLMIIIYCICYFDLLINS